jgi:hypothetical protein
VLYVLVVAGLFIVYFVIGARSFKTNPLGSTLFLLFTAGCLALLILFDKSGQNATNIPGPVPSYPSGDNPLPGQTG